MQKAKNGVSNHPTDQRRCVLKNLGALFYKFPLLRCWFGSAFLCTVFVRRARSLLFEVHDSLGALCQSLAPFGGAGAAAVHPRDAWWLRAQLVDGWSSLAPGLVCSQDRDSSDSCCPMALWCFMGHELVAFTTAFRRQHCK